jgi:hypothetical protein
LVLLLSLSSLSFLFFIVIALLSLSLILLFSFIIINYYFCISLILLRSVLLKVSVFNNLISNQFNSVIVVGRPLHNYSAASATAMEEVSANEEVNMYDDEAEAKPASSNTQGIMATESELSGCEAESEYYVMVRPGRLLMKISTPTKDSSKNGDRGFKQGRKVRCSKCQRPENDTTWRNMRQAKVLHAGHYWWDNTCPKCLMK